MMAYDSQFVLCVLHNDSPVREIKGSVSLPFHSEYKVRLKNKHNRLRAKAKVWIDGRAVSNLGDIILWPGQTLDLERFLDHDLNQGNKFKFVPLSDSRVNDPTDPENGRIKVEFYRELDNSIHIDWNPKPLPPANPWFPKNPPTGPYWVYDTHTVSTNDCWTGGASRASSNSINCSLNSLVPANASAGATVEGGNSNQSFSYGAHFATELTPVTLTLRVKGIKKHMVNINISDSEDAEKVKKEFSKIRFCSNCGARKRRKVDNFCHRCGESYPRKRGGVYKK